MENKSHSSITSKKLGISKVLSTDFSKVVLLPRWLQCNTNIYLIINYSNLERRISKTNTNIVFLAYELIWYSYSITLTWRIYISCIFGIDSVDNRHIFGTYLNIRQRISIIQIWFFHFICTNIFSIQRTCCKLTKCAQGTFRPGAINLQWSKNLLGAIF